MSYAGLSRKTSEAADARSTPVPRSFAGGLRIGETNDVYEQEADRVAEAVMTGSAPRSHWSLPALSSGSPLQRKCSCGSSGGSGGECDECKKKDQTLQRKAAGPAGPAMAPPIVRDALNSPGQPLDRSTRDYFEPRFGYNFSGIRVHTDAAAQKSATAVQALAYTVGSHIVFNDGRYAPNGIEGRKLLAHELAHTVQQRPGLFRKTPPDRPLRPHDPTASAPTAGACYGSAICKDLKTPSKLLAEAKDNPANKAKRDQRKQACNRRPPDFACLGDGHGAPATQALSLLKAYDASRPAAGVKLIVDKDLEQDFGALTLKCANFVPPVTGATDCIAIPEKMEKEATQFTTTDDQTIGGMERGKWRERTLEILVHESEHARFKQAFRADTLLANLPSCGNNMDAVSAMNELAAMLTEFRLRMERIRGSVALSSDDRAKEMNEWRDHRIRGTEQSITVSLRMVRCLCQCADANQMIRETIEFATSSWTQQEKNDLHREMRDPRWNDLDLRWPFVAPAMPSVHGP